MANTSKRSNSKASATKSQAARIPKAWVWSLYRAEFPQAEAEVIAWRARQQSQTNVSALIAENSDADAPKTARSIAQNVKLLAKKNQEKKRHIEASRSGWALRGKVVAAGVALAIIVFVVHKSDVTQPMSDDKIASVMKESLSSDLVSVNAEASHDTQILAIKNRDSSGAIPIALDSGRSTSNAKAIGHNVSAERQLQQTSNGDGATTSLQADSQRQEGSESRLIASVDQTNKAPDAADIALAQARQDQLSKKAPSLGAPLVTLGNSDQAGLSKFDNKKISYTDITGSVPKATNLFMTSDVSLFSIPILMLISLLSLFAFSKRSQATVEALRRSDADFDAVLQSIQNSIVNFNVPDDEIMLQRQRARSYIRSHSSRSKFLSWLGLK